MVIHLWPKQYLDLTEAAHHGAGILQLQHACSVRSAKVYGDNWLFIAAEAALHVRLLLLGTLIYL